MENMFLWELSIIFAIYFFLRSFFLLYMKFNQQKTPDVTYIIWGIVLTGVWLLICLSILPYVFSELEFMSLYRTLLFFFMPYRWWMLLSIWVIFFLILWYPILTWKPWIKTIIRMKITENIYYFDEYINCSLVWRHPYKNKDIVVDYVVVLGSHNQLENAKKQLWELFSIFPGDIVSVEIDLERPEFFKVLDERFVHNIY